MKPEKIISYSFETSTILDVRIHVVGLEEVLNSINNHLNDQTEGCLILNYVNAHGLLLAQKNYEFKEVLNASSILFSDGFGVKIAARILKKKVGQRMTPPDWFDKFLQLIIKNKKSIYFVGDESEVIEGFVSKIKEDYPQLKVSGYHNGFFDRNGLENEEILNHINTNFADVVVLGMGMPIQEMWSANNVEHLNSKIIFSTGALFRHYIGYDKRGPKFFTDRGLEWFFRMVYNPRKFWKRYLIGLPQLFFLLVKFRIKGK